MVLSKWQSDLTKLGYKEPLPAPSPAVQAILAMISDNEVHEYIREKDGAALLDLDDEGEHAPLLLSTLDLSHWTSVMMAATADKEKGLARLREAHEHLSVILEQDEAELVEAGIHTVAVDKALRAANPHEDWGSRLPAADLSAIGNDKTVSLHPLVARLNMAPEHKSAIEEYSDTIQTTQTEKALAALETNRKGNSIPLVPGRAVEEQLAGKHHRMWCLRNINLIAPISTPMYKIFANLTDGEVTACEKRALTCMGTFGTKPQELINAFPIALYDHHKCTSMRVNVHAKKDLLTCNPREEKYSSTVWNCGRPFIRCACDDKGPDGACTGTMLWFDHSVWYMINNLHVFFPPQTYPTLVSRFAAFLTWMKDVARLAVQTQITFNEIRRLMVQAATEFSQNPKARLLAEHKDATGARKIERFFKPAAFSLETPGNQTPQPYKKRKYVSPAQDDADQNRQKNERGSTRGGRNGGRGGGRGSFNKNYRSPGGFQIFDKQSLEFQTPPHSEFTRHQTPNSGSSVRISSPIKGRILNWEDTI